MISCNLCSPLLNCYRNLWAETNAFSQARFSAYLLTLLLWLFPCCSSVFALPELCQTPEILAIERPCINAHGGVSSFLLRFRYRPPKDLSLPTVVILPGGPGVSSIFTSAFPVPDEFGLLQTDPRGVGCNEDVLACEGEHFFGTDKFAEDIIAILRERAMTNYLFFGMSYGTVLATVTANKISHTQLIPPKAIILEGTVGHAFPKLSSLDGYQLEWQKIKRALAPMVRQELSSAEPPLGFSPETWGLWLSESLAAGFDSENNSPLEKKLTALSPESKRSERQHLIDELEEVRKRAPLPDSLLTLYRHVACRELIEVSPATDANVSLQRGELIPTPGNFCLPHSFRAPYDSQRWQIKNSTVIYFAGTRDPATPLAHARYHFRHQRYVRRYFIEVKNAGHTTLAGNLSDCAEALMRTIGRWTHTTEGTELLPTLKQCKLSIHLSEAPALTVSTKK